ncbi:putative reverse transcriptase domain-containing protein [Tanacetum coccineum]
MEMVMEMVEETMVAPTKVCGHVDPRDFDGTGGAVALTRWIEKMESVIDNSGCLANQSVKHWLQREFCPSNEIEKLEGEFWNHSMVGADHAGYTDRFHELAKLVPHLIRGMLQATQPATIQTAILTAGILTDEAVHNGTLAKAGEKKKERDEASKSKSVGKDKNKAKEDKCATIAKGRVTWPETVEHRLGMQSRYEQLGQEMGRELVITLERNRNTRGNENRARGRAFNVNVVDALQDPNVVTYSLNNLYATVLFDSGVDFSFISTKFAPLLNEKPSIANPGYVIEVANGKKEEVDRIFRGCRLELGDSIFPIDMIPLGQGNFDVIVGMDWLSNQKAVIMCHEKIVRIPIEEGKVLCVQGKRNVRKTKTLMSTGMCLITHTFYL